jgi:hypothetical protein
MHERGGAKTADRNRPGAERRRHCDQRALCRHHRVSQRTPLLYTPRIVSSEGARNRAPPTAARTRYTAVRRCDGRAADAEVYAPEHMYVTYSLDMHCPFSSLPSHLFHPTRLLPPYEARDSMRIALPTASRGAESTSYVPEASRTEFPLSGMPRIDLHTKQAFIARALRK